MHIKTCHIFQFRNLNDLTLNFTPKVNVITGANGAGKTAVLEAIHFLGLGRSFRVSQLNRIIQHNQTHFHIFCEFQHQSQKHQAGCQRDKSGNSIIKLDHEKQANQSTLARFFPVLLLNPERFHLLSQGAQQRRALLDWGAFYQKPDFLKHWQRARQLIKQRNAALKQQYPYHYMTIIDQALDESSQIIDQIRQVYFQQLQSQLQTTLDELALPIKIDLDYLRGWSNDQSLFEALSQHQTQDYKKGMTHVGPHRADLRFRVGQQPAQDILSRGQHKLLVTALKIAQGKIFQQQNPETSCLYLIDDLYSELDQTHLGHVFDILQQTNNQLIMTAIDSAPLADFFPKHESCHFHLENGQLMTR